VLYHPEANQVFKANLHRVILQSNGQESSIHRQYDICMLDVPSDTVVEVDELLLNVFLSAQFLLVPSIDYPLSPNHEELSKMGTLELPGRLCYRYGFPHADAISLHLPYDARLDELRLGPGEAEYTVLDLEQQAYWDRLARRVSVSP
jgi:hypothetical protein